MKIPQELKIQAMKEVPTDCKGYPICTKQPAFQMQCELDCNKKTVFPKCNVNVSQLPKATAFRLEESTC